MFIYPFISIIVHKHALLGTIETPAYTSHATVHHVQRAQISGTKHANMAYFHIEFYPSSSTFFQLIYIYIQTRTLHGDSYRITYACQSSQTHTIIGRSTSHSNYQIAK